MAASPQLKLVNIHTPQPATTDPVRQLFEHWAFMNGKPLARCKLGPARHKAISAALALGYPHDMLLAAIEGQAAEPFDDKPAMMVAAMRECEWLFALERRIEFFAAAGDALRAEAMRRERLPEPAAEAPPADPAAVAAARERLRALAAERRGSARG